jgi:hypothetical protein
MVSNPAGASRWQSWHPVLSGYGDRWEHMHDLWSARRSRTRRQGLPGLPDRSASRLRFSEHMLTLRRRLSDSPAASCGCCPRCSCSAQLAPEPKWYLDCDIGLWRLPPFCHAVRFRPLGPSLTAHQPSTNWSLNSRLSTGDQTPFD